MIIRKFSEINDYFDDAFDSNFLPNKNVKEKSIPKDIKFGNEACYRLLLKL